MSPDRPWLRNSNPNITRNTDKAVGQYEFSRASRFCAMRRRYTRLELNPGRLGLHVHVDALFAELVAPAGLLVATEGHVVVKDQLAVHLDAAGVQALEHPVGPADILRPGGGGQAVGGVVRQGHGLVLVVERQDRDNGPESL